MNTIPLSFFQQGVHRQLRASRELLAAMRRLEEMRKTASPEEAKEIDAVIANLKHAAEEIVDNASQSGRALAQLATPR